MKNYRWLHIIVFLVVLIGTIVSVSLWAKFADELRNTARNICRIDTLKRSILMCQIWTGVLGACTLIMAYVLYKQGLTEPDCPPLVEHEIIDTLSSPLPVGPAVAGSAFNDDTVNTQYSYLPTPTTPTNKQTFFELLGTPLQQQPQFITSIGGPATPQKTPSQRMITSIGTPKRKRVTFASNNQVQEYDTQPVPYSLEEDFELP